MRKTCKCHRWNHNSVHYLRTLLTCTTLCIYDMMIPLGGIGAVCWALTITGGAMTWSGMILTICFRIQLLVWRLHLRYIRHDATSVTITNNATNITDIRPSWVSKVADTEFEPSCAITTWSLVCAWPIVIIILVDQYVLFLIYIQKTSYYKYVTRRWFTNINQKKNMLTHYIK